MWPQYRKGCLKPARSTFRLGTLDKVGPHSEKAELLSRSGAPLQKTPHGPGSRAPVREGQDGAATMTVPQSQGKRRLPTTLPLTIRGPPPRTPRSRVRERTPPSVASLLGTQCPSSLWPPAPSDSRSWPCSCGHNGKGGRGEETIETCNLEGGFGVGSETSPQRPAGVGFWGPRYRVQREAAGRS